MMAKQAGQLEVMAARCHGSIRRAGAAGRRGAQDCGGYGCRVQVRVHAEAWLPAEYSMTLQSMAQPAMPWQLTACWLLRLRLHGVQAGHLSSGHPHTQVRSQPFAGRVCCTCQAPRLQTCSLCSLKQAHLPQCLNQCSQAQFPSRLSDMHPACLGASCSLSTSCAG